jgi:predicted dinucleotide-binding enzyme
MKIAIIGAGNVGATLGRAWLKRGHEIAFGVRDPASAKARDLAKETSPARVTTNLEAARVSEVVVLATPWNGTEAAIRACGDLKDKIVVDCTNPLKPDISGLELGQTTSGAERVAEWAQGAQVFKAMNQVGFRLMDAPQFPVAVKPVMFVCGDGPRKPVVMQLVEPLGFETIDAGNLTVARWLEPYAMLWIHLAITGKVKGDFAFALLRK